MTSHVLSSFSETVLSIITPPVSHSGRSESQEKPLPVYLFGFHVSAGEVFHTVHEAVLRHLVVGPQKLFKL